MSLNSLREAVEDKLRDNWFTTPIVYEDIPYRPIAGQAYVELYIMPGYTRQIDIGTSSDTYRSDDLVQIDINVSTESGTKVLSQYADSIIAIFKGQVVGPATFRSFVIAKNKIDGWTRWSIIFTILRDET